MGNQTAGLWIKFGHRKLHTCKDAFDSWLEAKEAPKHYDAAFLGFAKKWATPNATWILPRHVSLKSN
ncbi:hypothetical protein E4P82_21150 [Candidatus Competibacter phosphatis]|uniref:Uncharacterized protein n=1 Tax=Candidatus Competibacter phosphatis TaxID=221280 RepID=A0ABX1TU42_9GAMM|nr:hypothetical protein [Candidatus Competibacter phosphatis]NMQ21495.1 hypothetical protein [Candidatus Competibacter phosphatis]